MLSHIELLKQEFLAYLSILIFPSPEILIEKIPTIFQETKLNKIKIKLDNRKILFIRNKNKVKYECLLEKSDLGKFGFSLEDFSKYIESIKKEKTSKTFLKAIEEALVFNNKKLCEIYIPQAILAYTYFYEKFKLANSKEKTTEEIYDLIYEYCLKDIISVVNSVELCYNYLSFTMAYQHSHLDTIPLLETIPFNQNTTSTTKDSCVNILNTVKMIQRTTAYRKTYINLINAIEELATLQIEDKNTNDFLITELKNLTNRCFLGLLQAVFYKQSEKSIYEKEITKKFRDDCNQLINIYKKEHPNGFKKQCNILYKILRLIVGLIPTPILSNAKKMTLFCNKEKNNTKKITEITSQLDQLATLNFFSRIVSKS